MSEDKPHNKPQNCIYFLKSKAPRSAAGAAENELDVSKLVLKLEVSKIKIVVLRSIKIVVLRSIKIVVLRGVKIVVL